MKYKIIRKKRFLKHYKIVLQYKQFKLKKFLHAMKQLEYGQPLDPLFKDHVLVGNMVGYRECHLAYNIVMIYIRNDIEHKITLVDIGTHSQMFE